MRGNIDEFYMLSDLSTGYGGSIHYDFYTIYDMSMIYDPGMIYDFRHDL